MIGDNSWVVGMWLLLVCSRLVLVIDASVSSMCTMGIAKHRDSFIFYFKLFLT
jgi:hypothetical protein